jgi:hypothetical protein
MLEIGSTNEGCQFDVPQQYQSACCSPTDDNGKLQWVTPLPRLDSTNTVSFVPEHLPSSQRTSGSDHSHVLYSAILLSSFPLSSVGEQQRAAAAALPIAVLGITVNVTSTNANTAAMPRERTRRFQALQWVTPLPRLDSTNTVSFVPEHLPSSQRTSGVRMECSRLAQPMRDASLMSLNSTSQLAALLQMTNWHPSLVEPISSIPSSQPALHLPSL